MPRNNGFQIVTIVIVFFLAIGFLLGLQSPLGRSAQADSGCSYMVFTDGTYYYGEDCANAKMIFGGPSNLGRVPGTSAWAVLQNTVNLGGNIYVLPGTYVLTRMLNITANDSVFQGTGNDTIFTEDARTNLGFLITIQGSSVLVNDIEINGNSSQETGGVAALCLCTRGNGSTISHVTILNSWGQGILASANVVDYSISDNIITNTGDHGIKIVNTFYGYTNATITGNKITGFHGFGIGIQDVVGALIWNNTLRGTGGSFDEPINIGSSEYIIVSSNTSNDSFDSGIVVDSHYGNNTQYVTIEYNLVSNAQLEGIALVSNGGNLVRNVSIINNVVGNNGLSGSLHAGIFMDDSLNNTVSGNCVYRNLSSSDQLLGITDWNSSNFDLVSSNNISGENTPILLQGQDSVATNNILNSIFPCVLSQSALKPNPQFGEQNQTLTVSSAVTSEPGTIDTKSTDSMSTSISSTSSIESSNRGLLIRSLTNPKATNSSANVLVMFFGSASGIAATAGGLTSVSVFVSGTILISSVRRKRQ